MVQLINQKDNYNNKFGICLRGSAIFYVPPNHVNTSIILSNYWKFKNNIENIFVLANWRDMSGELIKREEISFLKKNVNTISSSFKNYHGSCEIEIFSSRDIKIPYSAIMVVYECKNSISMVHNYSRAYSNLEIEDGLFIKEGFEGCWMLRSNPEIENFAIIHNGFGTQPIQKAKIEITNDLSEKDERTFIIKELKPYETYKIKVSDIFPNLNTFLLNKKGSCSIQFKTAKSFPRMLIGWESKDKSELQVTHSDFDYSKQKTDLIHNKNQEAYVVVPHKEDTKSSLITYKERLKGLYRIKTQNNRNYDLQNKISIINDPGKQVSFVRKDGLIPSRIHTAIEFILSNKSISAICNLGLYHFEKAPKRFHWGLWSFKYNSSILVTTLDKIYGKAKGHEVCIKIYTEKSIDIYEKILNWDEISDDTITANINLKKIFDSSEIDKENYMYISIFSHYLGFVVFTTLEKNNSISLEHSF